MWRTKLYVELRAKKLKDSPELHVLLLSLQISCTVCLESAILGAGGDPYPYEPHDLQMQEVIMKTNAPVNIKVTYGVKAIFWIFCWWTPVDFFFTNSIVLGWQAKFSCIYIGAITQ